MRSLVFLASVLWVGSVFGGTLIPPTPWPSDEPVYGTVSFSGDEIYLQGGALTEGTTVAYVDLLGTAERMDLLSRRQRNGRAVEEYDVVASAQGVSLGNGLTRFSFLGMGLRTDLRNDNDGRGWYNGFGEGRGIFIGLRNGSVPATRKNEPERGILYSQVMDSTDWRATQNPIGYTRMGVTLETLDPPFGDATGDGRIDIADFGTLKDGFGQPTTPYQNGDVTGNLSVDMTDFGILKQNFGWKQSAVPEPSAFALLLLGIGAFFLRLFTK